MLKWPYTCWILHSYLYWMVASIYLLTTFDWLRIEPFYSVIFYWTLLLLGCSSDHLSKMYLVTGTHRYWTIVHNWFINNSSKHWIILFVMETTIKRVQVILCHRVIVEHIIMMCSDTIGSFAPQLGCLRPFSSTHTHTHTHTHTFHYIALPVYRAKPTEPSRADRQTSVIIT